MKDNLELCDHGVTDVQLFLAVQGLRGGSTQGTHHVHKRELWDTARGKVAGRLDRRTCGSFSPLLPLISSWCGPN